MQTQIHLKHVFLIVPLRKTQFESFPRLEAAGLEWPQGAAKHGLFFKEQPRQVCSSV